VSDALRYRIVDEPRPGVLQRFALPPMLVFIVATVFLPWGCLVIAVNAIALNGPHRNREIVFAILPIAIYFGALVALDLVVRAGLLAVSQANYLFVAAIGIGLVFAAFAFVSQDRTADLRQYLRQRA
jgi:hypothetical protein